MATGPSPPRERLEPAATTAVGEMHGGGGWRVARSQPAGGHALSLHANWPARVPVALSLSLSTSAHPPFPHIERLIAGEVRKARGPPPPTAPGVATLYLGTLPRRTARPPPGHASLANAPLATGARVFFFAPTMADPDPEAAALQRTLDAQR